MSEDGKKSIRELMVERLAKSGPGSEKRLVDTLVLGEEDKRHELLVKAFNLIEVYEGNVKGASRPDLQTFDGDGKPLTSAFSQSGIKQLKAAKDKLAKLQTTFDRCLETADPAAFKELAQLVTQGQGKAPSAEEVRAGG